MYFRIKRALKNKTFIFVDFFDTVMFRRVHPLQVKERWAVCMVRKYPALQAVGWEGLLRMRQQAQRFCEEKKQEPAYADIMQALFGMLRHYRLGELSKFMETSHAIEMALELGCQFPNRKLAKFLREARRAGKQVYCISDFYLSQRDMIRFAEWAGIDDCFDSIFVSSEYNRRKGTGELYPVVLRAVGATPDQVVMIGDQIHSDIRMAERHGIVSFTVHSFQWWKNQLSRRLFVNGSKSFMIRTIRRCFKQGPPFSEYIAVFYVFIAKLHEKLAKEGAAKAVFLAREGYFLQQLFHKYCRLCVPEQANIETSYFKCSRRSIRTVQTEQLSGGRFGNISLRNWFKAVGVTLDEVSTCVSLDEIDLDQVCRLETSEDYRKLMENDRFQALLERRFKESKEAFFKYVRSIHSAGPIHIVDVGWKGTMQQGIEQTTGIPTVGYYLGVVGQPDDPYEVERNGLIFSDYGGKSAYFDILRTNTQLYEQLLAAPHGSAQRYALDSGGNIVIKEEWVENEKILYETAIESLQKYMLTVFETLCVWSSERQGRTIVTLAGMVLRSALFADKNRLEFLRKLDEGFVWNFTQETKGITYEHPHFKINVKTLLFNPAEYTRYAAKIQRRVANNLWLSVLYYLFAFPMYLHIKGNQFVRMRLLRGRGKRQRSAASKKAISN